MIFRSLGVLSKGHMIEVDRSGLVGGYLGETALKTKADIDKAKGGILFIDEAYSLVPTTDDRDMFGKEAVDTILKYMEDYREDLIVILAGYEEEMNRLLDSNPGLRWRISRKIYFPDYEPEELCAIFASLMEANSNQSGPGWQVQLREMVRLMYIQKSSHFGNGRAMRNLFERVTERQASRLAKKHGTVSDQELLEFLPQDLLEVDVLAMLK